MKTTTKRDGKAAAMVWETVWSAYMKAMRSGDAEALRAAKADAVLWHSSRGLAVPAQFQ